MPTIITIESLDHEGARPYAHLTEPQLRNRLEPEAGLFIAESAKVIRVALDHGLQPLSLLTERRHLPQAIALLDGCRDEVPIYTAEAGLLESLTGYRLSRGVLAAMHRPGQRKAEEVCSTATRIAVVDGVANATNIGTIFRAAAALDFDAVLLSPTCCDPLNRRSVRVSMGTLFQVPWAVIGDDRAPWPERAIDQLHHWGFTTIALALRPEARRIDDPLLAATPRVAVLLGSEGDGLPQAAIDRCHHVAHIPMANGVDSLNVAAAAAVAFWQLRKEGQKEL